MPEDAPIARRYSVEGRVQGVGFRWFVHREAAQLGLRGFVRNTENGTVELAAEGPATAMTPLRGALDRGRGGSRGHRLTEQHLTPGEAEALRAFTIEGAW